MKIIVTKFLADLRNGVCGVGCYGNSPVAVCRKFCLCGVEVYRVSVSVVDVSVALIDSFLNGCEVGNGCLCGIYLYGRLCAGLVVVVRTLNVNCGDCVGSLLRESYLNLIVCGNGAVAYDCPKPVFSTV